MDTMNISSTTGFCSDLIYMGEPLSFHPITGRYEGGRPIVEQYNGKNYCGISGTNVVMMDEYRGQEYTVIEGSLIVINMAGSICSIRRSLFDTHVQFSNFLSPKRSGWKVTKNKKKGSVAQVIRIRERYVDVKLI